MLLSNIPAKIAAIFAASGTKNTIPLTTAGVTYPNNASFDVGFPPITMTPVISGGLPPFGADFNGLANAITAVQQWQGAGGLFPYDAAFSAAIGGYPKGATLLMSSGLGIWQSTVDNNTSDPDTGGANWVSLTNSGQFGASLGSYQKFPSGLIIQYGFISSQAVNTTVTTNNFPIAFPTSAAVMTATFGSSLVGGVTYAIGISANSKTQFTSVVISGGSGALGFNWLAIGY